MLKQTILNISREGGVWWGVGVDDGVRKPSCRGGGREVTIVISIDSYTNI